jgi:hypothetical protein
LEDQLDFSRLRTGEIIAGIGGVALLVFMFFHWYGGGLEISSGGTKDVPGLGEVPDPTSTTVKETGLSAWDSLTDFDGFLIALAGVSGIVLAAFAASGRRLRLGGLPRGEVTAFLGSLASLLIFWRIFAQPVPGADLKIGIFLGLAAAVAIAVGALMALREDGFEPLVAVAGGRTRAAPATPARSAASRSSTSKTASKGSGARKTSAKSGSRGGSSRSRSSSTRSSSSSRTRKKS